MIAVLLRNGSTIVHISHIVAKLMSEGITGTIVATISAVTYHRETLIAIERDGSAIGTAYPARTAQTALRHGKGANDRHKIRAVGIAQPCYLTVGTGTLGYRIQRVRSLKNNPAHRSLRRPPSAN